MSLYIPKMSDTPGVTIPGLASNFNALADSRIVEQGSNENGRYWRWENGLQICFVRGAAFTGDGTSDEKMGSWTHPAAFASFPAIVGRNAHSSSSPPIWHIDVNPGGDTVVTSVRWSAYRRSGFWSETDYYLHYIAIGRWK